MKKKRSSKKAPAKKPSSKKAAPKKARAKKAQVSKPRSSKLKAVKRSTSTASAAVFDSALYATLREGLENRLKDAPEKIYALSFYVEDMYDMALTPKVTLGYNTEEHYQSSIRSASDAPEARWNFAFWLQNEIIAAAHHSAFYDYLFKKLKLPLKGEQLAKVLQSAVDGDKKAQKMLDKVDTCVTQEFVAACVRVAKRLHEDGVIEKVMGRPVPIIIHELEYYDEIADQTERANPKGLVAEFCHWVRTLSLDLEELELS